MNLIITLLTLLVLILILVIIDLYFKVRQKTEFIKLSDTYRELAEEKAALYREIAELAIKTNKDELETEEE